MPIKGMTDRGLAFPEIGRIRKGDTGGKNGAPRDLSYFRVEFDEKEVEAAAMFAKKYGTEPQELNIILPFNEIERCWDAYLEAYTAGRMVARSDGEKYLYLVDVKTGTVLVKNGEPPRPYKEGEILGTWHNAKTSRDEPIKCKAAGRLKVIIPELGRAAFMTVLTGSIHDIINLSDQLRAFYAVNSGRIAGIPFILRRRPRKISTPRPDGTRARYSKWLLSIEADPEWVRRMLLETKRLALPGNGLKLLAEPGKLEDLEPLEGTIEEDEQDIPASAQPFDESQSEAEEGKASEPPADTVPTQAAAGTMEEFQILFAKAKELGLKPASVSVGTKPDVLAKICADLRGKINAKLDAEAMAA